MGIGHKSNKKDAITTSFHRHLRKYFQQIPGYEPLEVAGGVAGSMDGVAVDAGAAAGGAS